MTTARANRYTVTTSWPLLTVVSKSRMILGRATLTIEVSSSVMKLPMVTTLRGM
jgi:hypothetical protein